MNDDSLREVIGQAIGEASMCWSETPKGIFNSTKAACIVDALCVHINGSHKLQAAILGHMNSLRPLLDQWDRERRLTIEKCMQADITGPKADG